MYSHKLLKPDGRQLTLYSRYPIETGLQAPSPSNEAVRANPHLRWHPLRGEWVAYASHRQGRTFMPPLSTTRWHLLKMTSFPLNYPRDAMTWQSSTIAFLQCPWRLMMPLN